MREMIAPQSSLDANPKAKLLPLEKLVSNPFQVRQDFDSPEAVAALEELAADIREHGILQPILVRPAREAGKFEIVAGERRYRAAQIASVSQIPATVENFSDEEARLVSLTENLQRRDLNFKEEVEFLSQLNESRTQAGFGGESDLGRLIHKSRTYVAKRLKIAAFPDMVERVNTNEISINHAYTEAVDLQHLHLQLPFEKVKDKETVIGEEIHNVFSRNSYFPEQVLPFNEEIKPEQLELITSSQTIISPRTRNVFRSRIVPFSRLKEALKLVEQEIHSFKEEERSQLKKTLEELEQSLAQLKAKLYLAFELHT
jgi:ParB/RepB/Spo0J family partition protein